jgi:hypothetical protein
MKNKTYKERLIAGLKVLGYREIPAGSSKYAVFHKDGLKNKLFVGKNGALRSGLRPSGSFSQGDAGNQSPVYQRILIAGDKGQIPPPPTPFEYVVKWVEKDLFTNVPRECWVNFYRKEEAELFAAGKNRTVAKIKDCQWHPLYRPQTETGLKPANK